MNYARVLLGGIVGGIAYSIVSILIDVGLLMKRYTYLQGVGVFWKDPRVPFVLLWFPLLFVVSIGLVWLYAAARRQLGPGPKTALLVGGVVGLIGSLPANLVAFAWSHVGGFVTLFWTIEAVAGCMAATLVGAWMYKE